MTPVGFPHSDIRGSMSACDSPRLFAAGHVFLRLLVPRHPLDALFSLISQTSVEIKVVSRSLPPPRLQPAIFMAGLPLRFAASAPGLRISLRILLRVRLSRYALRLKTSFSAGGRVFCLSVPASHENRRACRRFSCGFSPPRRAFQGAGREESEVFAPFPAQTRVKRESPLRQSWWAEVDSNHRPHAYQACALTS